MHAAHDHDPARKTTTLTLLRGAVVVTYVCAIVLGIFLPIYTDEVGWRLQERAGLDGVDKMFSDICGANSLARPPFFMMPVRWFSAALNGLFAAPAYVRLSGIAYALVWGVLLLAVIRRAAVKTEQRLALGAIALGLLCLANTPLLMVLSRPEQPLILCAAAAMLLALRDPAGERFGRAATPAATAWARSLAILALTAVALSYHLKALFMAPMFIGCLLLASRGRPSNVPRAVTALAMAAMIAAAGFYWVNRLKCPDDPLISREHSHANAGVLLARIESWHDLPPVLLKIVRNTDPFAYVSLAVPDPNPLSQWLAPHQLSAAASANWGAALAAAWALVLALALAALVLACIHAWRQRRADPRLVLAALTIVTITGWSATQLIRSFYEAGFVLPLLALSAALLLAAAEPGALLRRIYGATAAILAAGAIVSVVLTAGIWKASLLSAWHQHGYVDVQGHSVAIRGFGRIEREIGGAARLCGIPPAEQATALMIDDVTYFPYMKSYLPQHQLGVTGIWHGTIRDPIDYLKSRGSDGMIVSCSVLPRRLATRARRNGEFCCLAPPDW